MKNRLFLFAVGLAFSVSAAFGQDYAFRVMASKGTNEVKSGDSWQAVKPGSSLKTGDELKLAENSYVGLIHVSSGKPVEVRDAGTHKVADLAKNIQPGQSVLNKYTDFILSSNAEGKKNKLSATGAVHRGTGASDISVFLPENQFADVLNNSVVINWESPKAGGPYVVIMKNMFDDELAKYETPETSLSVNLSSPELANESAILVEVSSKADPKTKSEQKLIKKMNPAQADKVKKELTDLGVDMNSESAIGKFYLAGIYEEKKLYIDAITAFEQAIKMESAYKEPYEDFLLRNKLKVAPQQ
jgi:hypothetical protein